MLNACIRIAMLGRGSLGISLVMEATFETVAFWVGKENLKCLNQVQDYPFVGEQPDFSLPSQSKKELK